MSSKTVTMLTPEIVLVVAAAVVYVAGAFFERARAVWGAIAVGSILVAAVALAATSPPGEITGTVTFDNLAFYGRWLALAAGLLLALMASRPLTAPGTPEYVGSLLLTVAGVMLVATSGELVLIFVGLEMVSIPTYILLYLGRRGAKAQEAAIKYFLLSILASAILLYGFSFLYGVGGSTDLRTIQENLTATGGGSFSPLVKVALVLIFAGLGFKIAAVPFHFYAPDVYQGTTQANAAVLSVVPKAAGMFALVRIVAVAIPAPSAWIIAMTLAALTMTLGNVLALWQDNVRRLLAYSSIAHAGYMLIGLAVALAPSQGGPDSVDGVAALLFYLALYAAATIGAFAVLAYLGSDQQQLDGVDELAGLARVRPTVAIAMAVFMFSLAGIPPMAGFWGKLFVFMSALDVDAGVGGGVRIWFTGLAILGVLNAAVAAAYYLRIVGVMYFRTPLAAPRAQGGAGAMTAIVLCVLLVVGLGVRPGPLLDESNRASPTARQAGRAPSPESPLPSSAELTRQ